MVACGVWRVACGVVSGVLCGECWSDGVGSGVLCGVWGVVAWRCVVSGV